MERISWSLMRVSLWRICGLGGICGVRGCFSVDVTETRASEVEQKFAELTERKDIAIVLINQHVRVRNRDRYEELAVTLL